MFIVNWILTAIVIFMLAGLTAKVETIRRLLVSAAKASGAKADDSPPPDEHQPPAS